MKQKVKSIMMMVTMVFVVLMMLSCQREDQLVDIEKTTDEQLVVLNNEDQVVQSFGSVYHQNSYNSKIVRDPGYVYQWKITDYNGTLWFPKVKFFGPDGTTTYIDMQKIGNQWILNKSLQKNGRYYWRYVDQQGNNLTSWNTYIDNIRTLNSGDDYPYPQGQCIPNTGACTDKWRFHKYNCTSWVAWRVNTMWGTDNAFQGYSHAYLWRNKLQQLGYVVNNEPIQGAIAYWSANAPGASSNGHVAFVEKVNRDSNGNAISIEISEYNYVPAFQYNYRILPVNHNKYPTAFIHIQHQL